MSVHYKFKSELEFFTLPVDGLNISVEDMKEAIIEHKKLPRVFDLIITNAETEEVYMDDKTLIPKNSSLIVVRLPMAANKLKKQWNKLQNEPTELLLSNPANLMNTDDGGQAYKLGHMASKVSDLTKMTGSESDKINAMMVQSTIDYHPTRYVKLRNSRMSGKVPPSYTCYRCSKKGHWISDCPLSNQNVRTSYGIPSNQLRSVDDPSLPGVMVTVRGNLVVYKQSCLPDEPLRASASDVDERLPLPEELNCPLCEDLMKDCVLVPCCAFPFCEDCIRDQLIDSPDTQCPKCTETGVSIGELIPCRYLRKKCKDFDQLTNGRYIKLDEQKRQSPAPQPALPPDLQSVYNKKPSPSPPVTTDNNKENDKYVDNNVIKDVIDTSANLIKDVSPGHNLIKDVSPGHNLIKDVSPGHNLIKDVSPGHNLIKDVSPGHNLIKDVSPGHNLIKDVSPGHNLIKDVSPVHNLIKDVSPGHNLIKDASPNLIKDVDELEKREMYRGLLKDVNDLESSRQPEEKLSKKSKKHKKEKKMKDKHKHKSSKSPHGEMDSSTPIKSPEDYLKSPSRRRTHSSSSGDSVSRDPPVSDSSHDLDSAALNFTQPPVAPLYPPGVTPQYYPPVSFNVPPPSFNTIPTNLYSNIPPMALPAVIDDPLTAFTRLMQEKDERKRQEQYRSRRRSPSPYGRPYYRKRSRSRDPGRYYHRAPPSPSMRYRRGSRSPLGPPSSHPMKRNGSPPYARGKYSPPHRRSPHRRSPPPGHHHHPSQYYDRKYRSHSRSPNNSLPERKSPSQRYRHSPPPHTHRSRSPQSHRRYGTKEELARGVPEHAPRGREDHAPIAAVSVSSSSYHYQSYSSNNNHNGSQHYNRMEESVASSSAVAKSVSDVHGSMDTAVDKKRKKRKRSHSSSSSSSSSSDDDSSSDSDYERKKRKKRKKSKKKKNRRLVDTQDIEGKKKKKKKDKKKKKTKDL